MDEESVTRSFSNYTIYHQLLKKIRTTHFSFVLGVVRLLELRLVKDPMSALLMTALLITSSAWIRDRKNRNIRRETCTWCHVLHHKSHMDCPRTNTGLRGKKRATNYGLTYAAT